MTTNTPSKEALEAARELKSRYNVSLALVAEEDLAQIIDAKMRPVLDRNENLERWLTASEERASQATQKVFELQKKLATANARAERAEKELRSKKETWTGFHEESVRARKERDQANAQLAAMRTLILQCKFSRNSGHHKELIAAWEAGNPSDYLQRPIKTASTPAPPVVKP